jgi:predicted nucleic acid-binding protein
LTRSGGKPAAERIALELETGALATTVVTALELRSGARSTRALEQLNELLGALVMLPLDERAATRAAEGLLTGNTEHFKRVTGLSLGRFSGGDG